MPEIITPAEARARFGEITAPVGGHRVHKEFEDDAGVWRPDFDGKMKLQGYRLYPHPKRPVKKVVWRPKGRR